MVEHEDASVIDYLESLLNQAIADMASDIHIEPYQEQYRIRCRLDGLLTLHAHIKIDLALRIITRLKILTNLDIAEKRLPQDGRFKFLSTQEKPVDIRISTCPTLSGEKNCITPFRHGNENV